LNQDTGAFHLLKWFPTGIEAICFKTFKADSDLPSRRGTALPIQLPGRDGIRQTGDLVVGSVHPGKPLGFLHHPLESIAFPLNWAGHSSFASPRLLLQAAIIFNLLLSHLIGNRTTKSTPRSAKKRNQSSPSYSQSASSVFPFKSKSRAASRIDSCRSRPLLCPSWAKSRGSGRSPKDRYGNLLIDHAKYLQINRPVVRPLVTDLPTGRIQNEIRDTTAQQPKSEPLNALG